MAVVRHVHCDMCGKDLGVDDTSHFRVTVAVSENLLQLDQVCLGLFTTAMKVLGYVRGTVNKLDHPRVLWVHFRKEV